MECTKVPHGVIKAKKKPVKAELDRIKQAEKKKKRLEKALANSAAIRSELEKKKQKKIEEQKRLDEEGAAIAEAVALNVLLDNDSAEQDEGVIGTYRNFPEHEIEAIGWVPNVYRNWNERGNEHASILCGPFGRNVYVSCSDETSVDFIVAQAVASLQIVEDDHFGPRLFGNVLRG